MDDFNLLSIRYKLLALFIIPLFIFLVVSLVKIDESGNRAEKISELQQLTDLAIHISSLVHETQKERGVTGIFLSSEGQKFIHELQQQRKLTDDKKQVFVQFLASFDRANYSDSFNRSLTAATDQLDQLDNFRLAVMDMDVEVDRGLYFYTATNSLFLDVIGNMIHNSVEPELTRAILAYVDFLKGKELAGIERAMLSAAFTGQNFSTATYYQFIQLVTEQQSYYQEFVDMATSQQVADFKKLSGSDYFTNVQVYRDIVHEHSSTGSFAVNPAQWFGVITAKINQLKILEDRIADDLSLRSSQLKEKAETAQWMWVSLVIFITMAPVLVSLWLVRQINTTFSRRLEEYRNLFEHSAAGMFVATPESRTFLFCNSAFASLLGRNKDEIPGLKVTSMHPAENREEAESLFKRFSAGEIDSVEEFPFLDGEGNILTVEIATFPILIEGERYIVGNIKDITERKYAEIAAQKSRQTLQTVLNSLNSAVAVIDPDTLLPIYLNQRAETLHLQSCGESSVWSLLDGQQSPRNLKPEVSESVDRQYIEQLSCEGENSWFEIKDKAIGWYDGRVLYLRMLEDITDRYKAEQNNTLLLSENRKLAQRNYDLQEQERRQIAAELHDQLGQLMTGIKLQADYIFHALDSGDSELASAAKDIVEASKELINTVQGVTNRLRPVILDQLGLVDALSDLVGNWQQISRETAFQFEVVGDIPDLSDSVSISAYRIVQECLTNANKHASASTISVSLKHEQCSEWTDNAALIVTISDNGSGMGDRSDQHMGMGMINMRERVQATGGVFKVLNHPGKGVSVLAVLSTVEPPIVARGINGGSDGPA